jgi:hypothetical protein
MIDMGLCKDCAAFHLDKGKRFGSCARWNEGYYHDIDKLASNEVVVENDEGWAALVGEEFGCVLFVQSDKGLELPSQKADD